jgi:hypothetical protein
MDSRLKSNQSEIVEYVPKKSNSTASTLKAHAKTVACSLCKMGVALTQAERRSFCRVTFFVMCLAQGSLHHQNKH